MSLGGFALSKPCAATLSDPLFAEVRGRFCFPLSVPSAACPDRAGRAVFHRIGAGEDRCAADTAALDRPRRHDLPVQLPVRWQDGGAEILAYQGVGNHLRTGAGVPIVQQEAVAAVTVGTQAADELFCPPELAVIHTGQLIHCRTPAYNSSWFHHPPAPPWHHRFSRFSPRNSRSVSPGPCSAGRQRWFW